MLSNHLTHAQSSLTICARTGRGVTMGKTGRSVFPSSPFPSSPARISRQYFNPFPTGNFAETRLFEVIRAVFWSLPGQKEPKLPKKLFYKSSTKLPFVPAGFGNGYFHFLNRYSRFLIYWLVTRPKNLSHYSKTCSLKMYNTAHTLFHLSIRKPVNTPYIPKSFNYVTRFSSQLALTTTSVSH